MDTSTRSVSKPVRRRRRLRTIEEKRRIVEETLQAGESVATVARRHEVNANQVFAWRRQNEQEQARIVIASTAIAVSSETSICPQ